MKIIDCFIFYNEIDLLNYRLNTLHEIVDYFIIVESKHTFIGKEKELFYNKNKELFEKFENKIINIIVDDFPYKYPNVDIKLNQQWENERYQRNCINKGLEKINLDCSDIIIITDVDEIPDREILKRIKNNEIKISINELEMDLYYCNLNRKKNVLWPSARIISYEAYKTISLPCNNIRFYNCNIIKNAGWHLSYFGNAEFIKNKIENFSHQELNISKFVDINLINERLNENIEIFGRTDNNNQEKIIPVALNNRLPYEYEKYLNKYYNL